MKRYNILAAVLALALTASFAQAKNHNQKDKADIVNGQITKIDGASVTIQPHVKKNAPAADAIVVTTNDATKVVIDGTKKSVSDLAVDQKVHVTLAPDHSTVLTIIEGKKKSRKDVAAPTPAPANAPATN